MKKEKRLEIIQLYLSKRELIAILDAANTLGLSKSAFCRLIIMNYIKKGDETIIE